MQPCPPDRLLDVACDGRDSLKCHHPIDFPASSGVGGEVLFEAGRTWSDVHDTVACEDRSDIEQFLIEEFAAPVLEVADHRLCHDAVVAVRPVQGPLARLAVVKT